jgi:branched-chain amino acid transport system ATP-binding protein
MTPIISTESLAVDYGPARALFDVSIAVEAGESVALLGSNGAGKSTLGKALAGLVRPSAGTITFGGQDITLLPAHKISRLSLAYIPEGRGIFPGLSVVDNLRMSLRRTASRQSLQKDIDSAMETFPILAQRRNQLAGTMSGGEQQMLALIRMIVGKPKLVIADEPSLGLAPLMVNLIFESLERARDAGATIILIEQFAHRALEFADKCVIMQRGHVTWQGPARDAKGEVLARYLGSEPADA